jgi:NADH-quinone oxidoreductase subunit L
MLFLCAGSVMHALNEETDIRKMGGLRRRMPVTAAAFTLGALALAGIPPLSAFWSKDEILVAVQEGLNPIFLVLLLGAIVLSALYMARAARVVFFGELARDNAGAHESPLVMSGPLVVLGALTLVIGVVALPLPGGYDGIGSFLYDSVHGPHGFEFSPLWTVVGTALALGGLGLGWRLYAGPPAVLERIQARFSGLHRLIAERYYMDAAYQWAIDQVVLRVSHAVAWFDRNVVNDRGVNGAGLTVVEAGRRLRYHVTGLFPDYGMAMVAGVGAIAVFLWLKA